MTKQAQLCAIEDSMTTWQKDVIRHINTAPDLTIDELVAHIAKEVKYDIDPILIIRYRAARKIDRLVALVALRDALR